MPTNYLDMLQVLPPTNVRQRMHLEFWPHR